MTDQHHTEEPFDPFRITRPDPSLMTYYLLLAGLSVVGFPIVAAVLWCKYHTLRYRFDEDGVSMSWGILFRKEINLTYRRIQDIHVTRDLFQRWMGLASIAIQTASGASGAEMTIEGITRPERLRDFLYSRMRGATAEHESDSGDILEGGDSDQALALLREIRDELRALRDVRAAES